MAKSSLKFVPVFTASTELVLQPGQAKLTIGAILPRRGGDSRALNAGHTVTLAESIAALGLLEPVVIDVGGHLLAGGHRLAALQLLAEAMPMARRRMLLTWLGVPAEVVPDTGSPVEGFESGGGADKPAVAPMSLAVTDLADRVAQIDVTTFATKYPGGEIPVVVVDVSEHAGPALALAVEAAENGVRRQYSRAEVQALAERLKSAGYTTREGRPRAGGKSARPVLEALLGCSSRQISRLLSKEEAEPKTEWNQAVAALERAAKKVQAAGKSQRSDEKRKLVEMVEKIMRFMGSYKP